MTSLPWSQVDPEAIGVFGISSLSTIPKIVGTGYRDHCLSIGLNSYNLAKP